MREYREPTCANFLKEPHILGVRLIPLLLLTFAVGALQAIGATFWAIGLAIVGYGLLKLHARYGKNGSEESLLFFFEKKISKTKPALTKGVPFEFKHPDTMDEQDQIFHKSNVEEEIREIRPGESRLIRITIGAEGASR
jgi:hypothetical protein